MNELKLITSFNEIDKLKWAEFIFQHPFGTIYQTPFFFEVYRDTKNYKPLVLLLEKNQKILGSLLAVIIQEGYGIKGKLTSRSLIIGGPLVVENDHGLIKYLLIEYEKLISREVIYTEVREIFNFPYDSCFLNNHYKEEKRLNIVVDLSKPEAQLWSEVHSKRRNEIKRAEKRGIVVKQIDNIEEINICYKILNEVYKRAHLPLAHKSLFENCYKYLSPSNYVRFIGAYFEKELIGIMLTLRYKDRVIDWYAGSSKKDYEKNPNDVIPWEAFRISKNDGFKIFDFGGAGKPEVNYGVRDYKKKFGGQFVELNRYQKIHKPLLMKIGKLGLKFWRVFQ